MTPEQAATEYMDLVGIAAGTLSGSAEWEAADRFNQEYEAKATEEARSEYLSWIDVIERAE